MVATIHYRWDFIGLSTDEKPTAENSERVVDGSTYYCSDTSKLYVWYKDQWYERKALGEGGGGSTINVVQTTGESTTDVMSQKAVTDTLADKQNTLTAGTGIDITNDVISATGGSGPTVVQSTGTSTTDVMSQNATTSMVFADPGTNQKIQIGESASATGSNLVVIGYNATAGSAATHKDTVAIGHNATASGGNRVAIGASTNAGHAYSVALGTGAQTTYSGELNISTGPSGNHGYNSSNYRLLTGLYDPQNDHDAATKGYVDTLIAALEARVAALEGN